MDIKQPDNPKGWKEASELFHLIRYERESGRGIQMILDYRMRQLENELDPLNVSLCRSCGCMTHTVHACGKCGKTNSLTAPLG